MEEIGGSFLSELRSTSKPVGRPLTIRKSRIAEEGDSELKHRVDVALRRQIDQGLQRPRSLGGQRGKFRCRLFMTQPCCFLQPRQRLVIGKDREHCLCVAGCRCSMNEIVPTLRVAIVQTVEENTT